LDLDTIKILKQITGLRKIHGVKNGEIKDILIFKKIKFLIFHFHDKYNIKVLHYKTNIIKFKVQK